MTRALPRKAVTFDPHVRHMRQLGGHLIFHTNNDHNCLDLAHRKSSAYEDNWPMAGGPLFGKLPRAADHRATNTRLKKHEIKRANVLVSSYAKSGETSARALLCT
jgi:predicted NUDIX family NTP pyrophosphohydrolase